MRTSISKEKLENYRRHHQGVWPEVERGLRTHGVTLLTVKPPLSCSTSPGCLLPSQPGPADDVFLPGSSLLHHHPHTSGHKRSTFPGICKGFQQLAEPMYPLPKEEEAAAHAHTSVSSKPHVLMMPPPAHYRSTNQQTAEIF